MYIYITYIYTPTHTHIYIRVGTYGMYTYIPACMHAYMHAAVQPWGPSGFAAAKVLLDGVDHTKPYVGSLEAPKE